MAFVQQSGSATTARIPKGKLTAKTESKELLKENQDCIERIVTNEGAKDVWLCLGTEKAVAKEGPVLKATTGTWTTTAYSGPVQVITAEGESNVTFAEV